MGYFRISKGIGAQNPKGRRENQHINKGRQSQCPPVKTKPIVVALFVVILLGIVTIVGTLGGLGYFSDSVDDPPVEENGAPSFNFTFSYASKYEGYLHKYLTKVQRAELDISTDFDVIIIGAGVSGLAAARTLLDANRNLKIVVLEGRTRSGGRILSTSIPQILNVELGASWLWGDSVENPLQSVLDSNDVLRLPSSTKMTYLYTADNGGKKVPSSALSAADSIGHQLEASLASMRLYSSTTSTTIDVPLSNVVDAVISNNQNKTAHISTAREVYRRLTSALTRLSKGIPAQVQSAYSFGLETPLKGNDAVLFNLKNIITYLSNGVDIRYSTPAYEVYYTDTNATVFTGSSVKPMFTAQYVVCTTPLAVLKADPTTLGIAFWPPLPDQLLESMSLIGVGHVAKIVLRFNTAFWDVDLLGNPVNPPRERFAILPHIINTTAPTNTIYNECTWSEFFSMSAYTGEAVLIGHAAEGGDCAQYLESMPPEEAMQLALSTLRIIFGASVPQSPVDYEVTSWSQDPYSLGSHSHYNVGGTPSDRATLAEPLGGSLVLAGEAFHPEFPSTLHGAYQMGVIQAQRILQALTSAPVMGWQDDERVRKNITVSGGGNGEEGV